ncbi:MAG: hypothetical protein ACOC0U_02205 [Desulfovibrionales bacterium]
MARYALLLPFLGALLLYGGIPVFSQDVILDETFQEDGTVLVDFGEDEQGRALVVLPNQDHVVAGFTSAFGIDENFLLVRFDENGTLDETFGDSGFDGVALTDFDGFDDRANALARQEDGKLIAAGRAFIDNLDYDFALARYNEDGTLDPSFGENGLVISDFDGENDQVNDLVIQEDGKILAAGTAVIDLESDFALARYNPDGTLDESFGTDGLVVTDFDGADDQAHAVVLQNDGRILVAGTAVIDLDSDFALAGYNEDGTLDETFGTDGLVITDFDGEDDIAYDLELQDDGSIVVVGSALIDGDRDFALARYDNQGILDESFRTEDGNGLFATRQDQEDPALNNTLLDRQTLQDADELEPGLVVTDFDGEDDVAFRLLIQEDEKILVAGSAVIDLDSDFALARYNRDGSLDESFALEEPGLFDQEQDLPLGLLVTDFDGEDDQARDIEIQGPDRILVAGTAVTDLSEDIALARYVPADEDDNDGITVSAAGCRISPNSALGLEWLLFFFLILLAKQRQKK